MEEVKVSQVSLVCIKGSTAKMYGFEGVSAPVWALRVVAEGHPLPLGGRCSLNARERTSFQGGTCRGWELDPACLDSLFSGLITGSAFPALMCCWTLILPRLRDVTTERYSSFSGVLQLLVRFAVLPELASSTCRCSTAGCTAAITIVGSARLLQCNYSVSA